MIEGVTPGGPVTAISIQWHGSNAIELTYKDQSCRPGNVLLYRDDEPRLSITEPGKRRSLDADDQMLRLLSEARRIRLAYLFDPYLAVHNLYARREKAGATWIVDTLKRPE